VQPLQVFASKLFGREDFHRRRVGTAKVLQIDGDERVALVLQGALVLEAVLKVVEGGVAVAASIRCARDRPGCRCSLPRRRPSAGRLLMRPCGHAAISYIELLKNKETCKKRIFLFLQYLYKPTAAWPHGRKINLTNHPTTINYP
jgi:hypothetical protein